MRERLVRRQEASGEHHLHRQRLADRARGELRASGARDDPETDLRESEARVVGRDDDVAGLGELAAASQAEAMHARDQGLLEAAHALPAIEVAGGHELVLALRHRADIGACGERAPGAEQHDAAHRVVGLDRA